MWDSKQCDSGLHGYGRAIVLVGLLVAGIFPGCEKTTHDSIDKWMRTEKGPKKLVEALEDSDLGIELRAHAGQNLIRMDDNESVLGHLEKLSADKRGPLVEALARRLWEDARIEGEFTMPSGPQVTAKDALFDIRRFAEGEPRRVIDGFLIDWLADGYYSARARAGRHSGEAIVGAIGESAAPPIIQRAKAMLAAGADNSGAQVKLEDPLLRGLAVTGTPDGVGLLLDMLTLEHNDKTLSKRALTALFVGYVKNDGTFPVADAKALLPHLERLVELAKNPVGGSSDINDAIQLIAATGAPACIQPLVNLVAYEHEVDKVTWVAANSALQCGKANALVPVADAFPRNRNYARRELRGAVVEPMLVLDDKPVVARQARTLLESKSWVARAIGVELLSSLKQPDSAVLLRKLASDKTVLRGWWGDQTDLPKRDRKKEPRLGQLASEVADQLDPGSKSG